MALADLKAHHVRAPTQMAYCLETEGRPVAKAKSAVGVRGSASSECSSTSVATGRGMKIPEPALAHALTRERRREAGKRREGTDRTRLSLRQ